MAKRISNLGVEIEYIPSNNTVRVTNEGVQVEYTDIYNIIRASTVAIQIEYGGTSISTDLYGPGLQSF